MASDQETTGDASVTGFTFPSGGFSMGLTKREYFAALATQGLLSNPNVSANADSGSLMAKAGVQIADALIDALNDQG